MAPLRHSAYSISGTSSAGWQYPHQGKLPRV